MSMAAALGQQRQQQLLVAVDHVREQLAADVGAVASPAQLPHAPQLVHLGRREQRRALMPVSCTAKRGARANY